MGKFCIKLCIVGVILAVIGSIGLAVLSLNGLLTKQISLPVSNEELSDITIPIEAHASDINKLDIDISGGYVYITKGPKFNITANNINEDELNYEINDDCLTIGYSQELYLLNLNGIPAEITITLPEKTYENIDFSMQAGELEVEGLHSDNFNLEFTAGEADFYDVIVNKSAKMKMSAGESDFNDCTFYNTSIKMTAGDMYFDDCCLNGNNSINMTAGEINVSLLGKYSDYNFDIDKTAGEVSINGEEFNNDVAYTTVTSSDDINSDSNIETSYETNNIAIKITAGECNIEFAES